MKHGSCGVAPGDLIVPDPTDGEYSRDELRLYDVGVRNITVIMKLDDVGLVVASHPENGNRRILVLTSLGLGWAFSYQVLVT